MVRVVREQGSILIYVWAYEQDEKNFTQQDVFVPWNLQKKYVEDEDNDENVIYKRYYHLFKKEELQELTNKIKDYEV